MTVITVIMTAGASPAPSNPNAAKTDGTAAFAQALAAAVPNSRPATVPSAELSEMPTPGKNLELQVGPQTGPSARQSPMPANAAALTTGAASQPLPDLAPATSPAFNPQPDKLVKPAAIISSADLPQAATRRRLPPRALVALPGTAPVLPAAYHLLRPAAARSPTSPAVASAVMELSIEADAFLERALETVVAGVEFAGKKKASASLDAPVTLSAAAPAPPFDAAVRDALRARDEKRFSADALSVASFPEVTTPDMRGAPQLSAPVAIAPVVDVASGFSTVPSSAPERRFAASGGAVPIDREAVQKTAAVPVVPPGGAIAVAASDAAASRPAMPAAAAKFDPRVLPGEPPVSLLSDVTVPFPAPILEKAPVSPLLPTIVTPPALLPTTAPHPIPVSLATSSAAGRAIDHGPDSADWRLRRVVAAETELPGNGAVAPEPGMRPMALAALRLPAERAPVVAAREPPAPFAVASDRLGDVRIGIEGTAHDLKISLGLAPAAAAIVAADAPRLIADLAAGGVRLQSLDLSAGAFGNGQAQTPGQSHSQHHRGAAATPPQALQPPMTPAPVSRLRDRYA